MNFSLLQLDDIYHPKLVQFYQYSLILSFTISTFTLISAIYIILTQIKKAQVFKYILIYQLCWSYLFCTLFVSGGFIPLYPVPALYISNIFKSAGPEIMNILEPLYLLICIGYVQAYFLGCCYRVTYASVFTRFQHWFENPKRMFLIQAGMFTTFAVIVVGPFLFSNYDPNRLQKELFSHYPILNELSLYEPSIIAQPLLILPTYSFSITIVLIFSQIYVTGMFFLVIAIYLTLLCKSNKFLSAQTQKSYRIVVRAQSVQVISSTTFLFVPYCIQFIVNLLELQNGSLIALISQFFLTYHLILEIMILFYFIKPFREYLVQLYKNFQALFLKTVVGIKNQEASTEEELQ